jgi:hypothetical protein
MSKIQLTQWTERKPEEDGQYLCRISQKFLSGLEYVNTYFGEVWLNNKPNSKWKGQWMITIPQYTRSCGIPLDDIYNKYNNTAHYQTVTILWSRITPPQGEE